MILTRSSFEILTPESEIENWLKTIKNGTIKMKYVLLSPYKQI